MKERPILFSAPMVRAILDGRKTQTRRVVKPEPAYVGDHLGGKSKMIAWKSAADGVTWNKGFSPIQCPYGEPGDRLWVREAHMRLDNRDGGRIIRYRANPGDKIIHSGNGDDDWRGDNKWTPSIHMRREYSRITLEVVDVRVERLQEISEQDAGDEGWYGSVQDAFMEHPLDWFRALWDSINAARGFEWDKNPWVWVVEFKRIAC